MEPTEYVVVVTTTSSEEAAHSIASACVDTHLGACSQVIGPMTSVYFWQGRRESALEWRVETKTTAERIDALIAHILEHHDYELPEVLVLPIINGSPAYLSWVRDEVTH